MIKAFYDSTTLDSDITAIAGTVTETDTTNLKTGQWFSYLPFKKNSKLAFYRNPGIKGLWLIP